MFASFMAPFFLASRMIQPKRKFLVFIASISVLGVTLGVAVLIIVMAVMTGFEKELQQKIIGFDPHIVITNRGLIDHWNNLNKQIKNINGIIDISPFVQGPVILDYNHQRLAPIIRGIIPELEKSKLTQYIISGAFDLSGDQVVIGSDLANILGIHVGDIITLFSPHTLDPLIHSIQESHKKSSRSRRQILEKTVLPTELTVSGIFHSGRYTYDSQFLFIDLTMAQELYGLGNTVHGIACHVKYPDNLADIQAQIKKIISKDFSCLSWIEMNKEFFDAMALEKNVMLFLLMFIILVAAFGIMNTLITTTIQKVQEIGILKALGTRTSQIVLIFLIQGIVIGIIGVFSGLILAITLLHWRNEINHLLSILLKIDIFPYNLYDLSTIPSDIILIDVMAICITAMVICAIASLIPAVIAAKMDPLKALRAIQ